MGSMHLWFHQLHGWLGNGPCFNGGCNGKIIHKWWIFQQAMFNYRRVSTKHLQMICPFIYMVMIHSYVKLIPDGILFYTEHHSDIQENPLMWLKQSWITHDWEWYPYHLYTIMVTTGGRFLAMFLQHSWACHGIPYPICSMVLVYVATLEL